MGAPELPNEDDVRPTLMHLHHQPLPSEDSDDENWAEAGYLPLAQHDLELEDSEVLTESRNNAANDSGDEIRHVATEEDQEQQANEVGPANTNETTTATTTTTMESEIIEGDPNMPPIESVDVQLTRQVWSEPRPKELQIELDKNKTQQILSVMSHITLPNLAVPDWAAGVPEERWKDELLQRIRQRKEPAVSEKEPSTAAPSNSTPASSPPSTANKAEEEQ